jgi:hypothetical protein
VTVGDQSISGLIEMEGDHKSMAQTQQTVLNAQSFQPCKWLRFWRLGDYALCHYFARYLGIACEVKWQ